MIGRILQYDDMALVQKYIEGEEYSCGCIENLNSVEVLPLIRVRSRNIFLGYREKVCKLGVSERIVSEQGLTVYPRQIADVSKRIFTDLLFENMFRLDFILSEGKLYFLEVNSLPGLNNASFFAKMLQAINLSVVDFIQLTYQNSLRRVSTSKVHQFSRHDMDWSGLVGTA